MGEPCQYVFRYNGDEKTDEIEVDLQGEKEMPRRGQILVRNGKQWKVVMVSTTRELSPSPPVPIHRVMLTDNINLPI
jgi:hypothetical protein